MVIISLILVGIIIAPYIFFNSLGNSESRMLKKKFKNLAIEHNLKLSDKEDWGNSIIGLDKENGKLIFMNLIGETVKSEIINLDSIKNVRLDIQYKEYLKNHKKERNLENLDLILSQENLHEVILNFYNRENYYYEENENVRAEKWKMLISENLKTFSKRAA